MKQVNLNKQLVYLYSNELLKTGDNSLDDGQFLEKVIRDIKLNNRIDKIKKIMNKINGF